MDLGNIIYVVAIIAYFIYQATRKKGQQDLPEEEPQQTPPQKGMTFEDLLKEIRQAQNPSEPVLPAPPKPQPPIPQAAKPIPQTKPVYRKPVVAKEEDEEARYYEGAYSSSQKTFRKEFKDAPLVELKKIDYDALNQKKANPYAELLKNPKTLKQAVVVSEILKPKYF